MLTISNVPSFLKSLVAANLVKRQMIGRVGVAFFPSPMEERLLTPVPRTLMVTHRGVHLILSTLESGLTAVSYASFILDYLFPLKSEMDQ